MAGRHVRNRDPSLGLKSKLLRCDRQLSQPARSAGEQARHADQGQAQESENNDDCQEHDDLLERVQPHVAAVFAAGGEPIVVEARIGAPLTAWALVPVSAVSGAVGTADVATEARGGVASRVASVNVGRAVGVAPAGREQGHGGERKAMAGAQHLSTAWLADDAVTRILVVRLHAAAAVV